MKVLYNEDLANRVSPESCGGSGNIAAEALTGEHAGGLLSSEITAFRVPTSCIDSFRGQTKLNIFLTVPSSLPESF